MEIKHTIEILTKDIQDIENLVRNFENYPVPPQIEIDLAMAKLRNAYDLLHMISEDTRAYRSTGIQPPAREAQAPENTSYTTTGKDIVNDERAAGKEPADTGTDEERSAAEGVMPEPADSEGGQADGPVDVKTPGKETPSAEKTPPPAEPGGATDVAAENRQVEPDSKEPAQEEIRKASILAEKFATGKSINEKIAPGGERNLSSRLTGEAIDSIKRHIGLNDRFLIIRELMHGNNEAYDQLIRQLDECSNFDHALEIISSTFPEKQEHEGVEILVKLARRKYLVTNG